jgi:hypothetical protein
VVDQAWSAYGTAAERVGEVIADIEIAGMHLRLCFAGVSLAEPIMSPLRHRRTRNSAPKMTIAMFDGRTTGVTPAISLLNERPKSDRTIVKWGEDNLQLLCQGHPIATVQTFDTLNARAVFWVDDVAKLKGLDRYKPILQMLRWSFARGPWQPVHAAAVCGPRGGVLLGGRGGSGKSTTALACVRAGWRYAGDDYVLIRAKPEPSVENIFSSAHLREDMLSSFPTFHPTLLNAGRVGPEEKAVFRLSDRVAREDFSGFTISAILLPKFTGGRDSRTKPAPRSRATIALAPTSLFVLHGDSPMGFRTIAEFVETLPTFWLELGTDTEQIPAAIERLLVDLR